MENSEHNIRTVWQEVPDRRAAVLCKSSGNGYDMEKINAGEDREYAENSKISQSK